jgi:hypothetical protein
MKKFRTEIIKKKDLLKKRKKKRVGWLAGRCLGREFGELKLQPMLKRRLKMLNLTVFGAKIDC